MSNPFGMFDDIFGEGMFEELLKKAAKKKRRTPAEEFKELADQMEQLTKKMGEKDSQTAQNDPEAND